MHYKLIIKNMSDYEKYKTRLLRDLISALNGGSEDIQHANEVIYPLILETGDEELIKAANEALDCI